MKIVLDVLSGSKIMNQLMHSADVFENSKQLADKYSQYGADSVKEEQLDTLCELTKKQLEKDKSLNVVFVGIYSIDGKRQTNPRAYIMPGVNSISTGNKWGVFSSVLNKMGYECETDEHACVTSVKGITTKEDDK